MAYEDQNIRSCQCGAMIVVPDGHEGADGPVRCSDCDKPIGMKVYEALSWRHN